MFFDPRFLVFHKFPILNHKTSRLSMSMTIRKVAILNSLNKVLNCLCALTEQNIKLPIILYSSLIYYDGKLCVVEVSSD